VALYCGVDDGLAAFAGQRILSGQEYHAHGQILIPCQPCLEVSAQELVGDLGQDTGAVARASVGIHGAAVGQVDAGLYRKIEDARATLAGDVGNEPDSTGVMFVNRVVEQAAAA